MRKYFTYLVGILLVLAGGLTGCKKNNDVTATVLTGSIRGKISPATAATNILIADRFLNPRYSGTPGANGNFKMDNMEPGAYVVRFTAALGFSAPENIVATVTAGDTEDIGSILFDPIVAVPKAIDTIQEDILLSSYNPQSVNDFITRAKAGSAIVLLGRLRIDDQVITPELANALNKIIIIKQELRIIGAAITSLTFDSLKELNWLFIDGAPKLTSVNLSALKTLNWIELNYCGALTNLNIGAVDQFSGLRLYSTGLRDLSAFKSAKCKARDLMIQQNRKLTSLAGLNFATDSVYTCTISGNDLLTSLDGLQGIKRCINEISIAGNPVLQTLAGLDNITTAKQLTLSGNPQLSSVCPAKQLINILEDAPPYQVRHINQFTNQVTYETIQPLVASSNGSYATRADLVAAIGHCP